MHGIGGIELVEVVCVCVSRHFQRWAFTEKGYHFGKKKHGEFIITLFFEHRRKLWVGYGQVKGVFGQREREHCARRCGWVLEAVYCICCHSHRVVRKSQRSSHLPVPRLSYVVNHNLCEVEKGRHQGNKLTHCRRRK